MSNGLWCCRKVFGTSIVCIWLSTNFYAKNKDICGNYIANSGKFCSHSAKEKDSVTLFIQPLKSYIAQKKRKYIIQPQNTKT